ncbi:hypothetical protein TNCV_4415121 [Trichonephila clavipes]|uniref:Uncharacterized protein n=1 Tax=Trichonephila clavipes TaxID=2585209 RepID=A0A8X6S065_TRICX|nr:hypothetical protein TNCV_4415121 [Trichonephila clavipes]
MRYSKVVDLSRDGLLPQRTNGVGTKTEDAGCKLFTFANQKLLGRERGPPRGFKESVRKVTMIFCFPSATQRKEFARAATPEKIKRSRNCEELFKIE